MDTKEIELKTIVIIATNMYGYSEYIEKHQDETIKNFKVFKKILEELFQRVRNYVLRAKWVVYNLKNKEFAEKLIKTIEPLGAADLNGIH